MGPGGRQGGPACHNTLDLRLWDSDDPIPRRTLLEMARGVTGLLSFLTDRIDAEILDAAGPSLKVVSNLAVGYDNVDVDEATRRGVLVTNTPGVLTEATADLTWALILAAARRLGEAADTLRNLEWKSWSLLGLAGMDVHGATLGVVGAGRIGRAVARRAAGFRMKVLYHSRRPHLDFEQETGAEHRPRLEDLLRDADIVTLHVPLTSETRGLIGKREFGLMKPSAVLVNTARGAVVDEPALYEALSQRRIFAAGLDVFVEEPLPEDSPLRRLPNVILLPHVGSATVRTRLAMATMAATNLADALEGRRPAAMVNPEVRPDHPRS
ncbi:MAG: D-glycerate dehydrogenase [Bacillota bacterium]|nr:MAG: D-glycerate dehydrogenase [Bacillota bacterium]